MEQLGKTPLKISMLALLLCFEAHAKALEKFLKTAHVPQETSNDQFKNCVASLTAGNGLGFSDTDLTPKGRKHNDALHVSIECMGHYASPCSGGYGLITECLAQKFS